MFFAKCRLRDILGSSSAIWVSSYSDYIDGMGWIVQDGMGWLDIVVSILYAHHFIMYSITFYLTSSHLISSYCILSYLILFSPIMSYLILSYSTVSNPILSCRNFLFSPLYAALYFKRLAHTPVSITNQLRLILVPFYVLGKKTSILKQ